MTGLGWARPARDGREGGFILLESVIAITVITIVMSAVGVEFLGATAAAGQQRAQQVAVQLADSTVEQIRSLDASDLVTGRGSGGVSAQFGAATDKVQPWLASMDETSDATVAAGSGAGAAVPTSPVIQTPGTVAYAVSQYLGLCSIRTSGSTDCVKTSTLAGVPSKKYLRAVVAVTWGGPRCSATTGATRTCAYVTSTLVSAAADPTFRINAAPYAAPLVTAKPDQTYVVGDDVSLQMYVQNGTGVPLFTWAVSSGALPAGLDLSPNGLISGTVAAPAGTYSAFIQVTDAFLRKDTQEVRWTVKPALVLTDPGPQLSNANRVATPLTLTATGGDGAPFTYSIVGTSLPPGLTLATTTGVISGTPTTVGTYTVQAKVVDKTTTRSAVRSFTWRVDPSPVVATTPGTQVSTVNTRTKPVQLSASGGSGSYEWTDPTGTLPPGLSISTGGLVTGTATTVTTGKSVTLTVKDPAAAAGAGTTVTFIWRVVARPTVTTPANQSSVLGDDVTFTPVTSCPNSPCAFTLTNGPTGLGISASGVVTGTVGGTVQAYTGVTIGMTDADGATVASTPFTWTVTAGLVLTDPGPRAAVLGQPTSLTLTATGGAGTPYTFSVLTTSLPPGLTLDPATGVVSGTPSRVGTYTVQAKVVDRSTTRSALRSFTWTVDYAPIAASNPGPQVDTLNTPIKPLQLSASGGAATYVWSDPSSTLPAGLTISSSGLVSGTPSALTSGAGKSVSLMVSDPTAGPAYATTVSFLWSIVAKPTVTAPATSTVTLGQTVGIATTTTCPNSPCTYTLAGGPTGLSVNGTGVIVGTVGGTAPATYSATITVKDNDGATATSAAFTINVRARPTVTSPGNQVNSVGDGVTLTPATTCPSPPCTYSFGATVPSGITISSSGVISGSVGGPVNTFSGITIMVTDAAGEVGTSAFFTWTVNAALVLTAPGSQQSTVGQSTSLTLGATGGEPPYTFSVVGNSLPPGLTLAAGTGVVSGTPTTAGTYTVSVKVVDKTTTRSDVESFTWRVEYAAVTPTNPGTQVDTVTTPMSPLQLSASGGSGSYVWSDPSGTLPPGLTISSSGLVTGTPTTLTSGSGKSVTLTVADPTAGPSYTKTLTFLWSIVARPTVTAPSTATVTLGQSVSIPATTTCPNSPCTYTLANGPSGLTVNGAGVIVGTVGGTAPVTYSATITVRDSAGATDVSAAFAINVRARPTVTAPGNRASTVGSSTNVQLTTACTNTPCSYAFGGTAPTGLSISSTGLITGTVGTPVQTFSGITVVVTDAGGATATSAAFSWTVNAAPTMASPGNQTTQRGATVSLDASALDSGGTSPYTFGATNLPTWLSINATTGRITGTAPNANSATVNITLRVTDGSGVTATSPTFRWNVTNLANTFGNQTTFRSSPVSKDLDATSSGGNAPLTYAQTGLPTWLTLTPSTGVISGTSPSVAVNSSTRSGPVTVTVTDGAGASITLAPFYWYNTDIVWSAPATVDTGRGQNMAGYSAANFVNGGATTKTYTAVNLPTGLTMASNGAITGSTTISGVYTVTLTVTDSVGATLSTTLRWTVS